MPLEALAQLIAEDFSQSRRPIKIALMSCGLGRVHRGFEVSTKRLFDALQEYTSLDVRLLPEVNLKRRKKS